MARKLKRLSSVERRRAIQSAPMLHHRFVRALLIRGLSNRGVADELEIEGLPSPPDLVLDAMRLESKPPKDFRPDDRAHAPSLRFLVLSEVEPFFRDGSLEAREAFSVLRAPRIREFVEAGLLAGVPLKPIVGMLDRSLSFRGSEQGLAWYRAAFLDIDRVSRVQLRALVEARVRVCALRGMTPEPSPQDVRRAVERDARMVALTMPSSALAWHAVVMALGFTPTKADLAETARQLESLAAVRAAEAVLRSARDDERRAQGFVAVARDASAISAEVADPTAALHEVLQGFTIRRDETRLPLVSDFAMRGEGVGTLEPLPVRVMSTPPDDAPAASPEGDPLDTSVFDS